jgi:predicted GNAT superfamily acetyltransferase
VGFAGWVGGRPIHWSDMLAVLPEARDLGLGRRLKEFQRDTLLERGVRDVYWTFDPLESRNAHLNFGHLGVTCREYVRDCYGQSASHLHAGLATDRFVVHWALDRCGNGRGAGAGRLEQLRPGAAAAPMKTCQAAPPPRRPGR